MKKIIYSSAIMAIMLLLNGCLIFHKISYEITTEGTAGTARVTFHDIRSDAQSPSEFDEDKDQLFNYIWKSDKFIEDMKQEGKEILDRELYLSGDTLNGKVVFKVSSINNIEEIVFEDNFYYLTIPLEDSIITTNGEIIISKNYKRILWDNSINHLNFEILGFSFDEESYRSLGYHFKSLK